MKPKEVKIIALEDRIEEHLTNIFHLTPENNEHRTDVDLLQAYAREYKKHTGDYYKVKEYSIFSKLGDKE